MPKISSGAAKRRADQLLHGAGFPFPGNGDAGQHGGHDDHDEGDDARNEHVLAAQIGIVPGALDQLHRRFEFSLSLELHLFRGDGSGE